MKSTVLIFFMILNSIWVYTQDLPVISSETISFEQMYPYLVTDSSKNDIWQIGGPHKFFLDSAYEGYNCIITDSVNFYPSGNHSFFDIYIGSFNYGDAYPLDIFVGFKHKFDTDTLRDGGYITVSYDYGKTWMNILKDTVNARLLGNCAMPVWENGDLYSLNDTLYNGESGFSGRSNGWISTWFAWHYCPVKGMTNIGDTMILRFNFISDSVQTNKEGWMIDNISLYSCDLGSSVQNSLYNSIAIYPNPFTGQSLIKLDKNYAEVESELYDLNGKLMYSSHYKNTDQFLLNRNGLNEGTYFLRILLDKKNTRTVKVVINN